MISQNELPVENTPSAVVDAFIRDNQVAIFSKSYCPFCEQVKHLFTTNGVSYASLELDLVENGADLQVALYDRTGQKSVPNVFVNERHVGGCDSTLEAHASGQLRLLLYAGVADAEREFDLIVIGGGSAGLACAKEAAGLGARVCVCDFVWPSTQGASWGLGGTCVNVGCIPKKLMHQASLLGEDLADATSFGWPVEKPEHRWTELVEAIQRHIASLNWAYRVQLRERSVTYLNACAEFVDAHTLKTVDKKDRERVITGKYVVLATGGRPHFPDIPGAERLGISSDDLFSLSSSPGRTLIVGASYVALECAGFLRGLDLDVTVMVRSILLRGFDQQLAELVGEGLVRRGVRLIRGCVPTCLCREDDGRIRVFAQLQEDGDSVVDMYDTVLFATGRRATTQNLALEKVGVQLAEKDGKVVTDAAELTSVENIYAIGDVASGRPELTPVGIHAGKLLARRLIAGSTTLFDYEHVPTTVFTPDEYACVGLSEEEAVERYGEEDLEVYHQFFTPLQHTVPQRPENASYAKLIAVKSEQERVVGVHLLGPHAGEVVQGLALALRLGATKQQFDATVGIHPTVAEQFTFLSITKSSGVPAQSDGC